MKKTYIKLTSVIIIISILLNVAGQVPVKAAANNGSEGMTLYESGNLIGTYTLLEDALNAMDNPSGDYKVIFGSSKMQAGLSGKVELPEVSSITLVGVFETDVNIFSVTNLYVDDDISLHSDLTLKNIDICQTNDEHDTSFKLNNHTLKIQGDYVNIRVQNSFMPFNLEGDVGSCLDIDNTSFYFNSNIIVDNVYLGNGAIFGCQGKINKIKTLITYGNKIDASGKLFINQSSYSYAYYSIEQIKMYKKLNIDFSPGFWNLDIGSVTGVGNNNILFIYAAFDTFLKGDKDFCINIKEKSDISIYMHFNADNMTQNDYKVFCDTSVLCAPQIPLSQIECYFYIRNTSSNIGEKLYKDEEGNIWLEPVDDVIENPLCYELNEEFRDMQEIYYSLDDENMTAVVGKDSDLLNTAGYRGANNGEVTIPAFVEKDGLVYTVTKIGRNSFSRGNSISKLKIADTVIQIGEKAFFGTAVGEMYIGSGVEEIGEMALCAEMLQKIYVSPDNQYYFSSESVLFDKPCETLIRFPAENSYRMRDYTVPYSVKAIAPGAFSNTNIGKVILSDSVEIIGEGAFHNCGLLKEFQGNQVVEMKDGAFAKCGALKFFEGGKALRNIGSRVFNECKSLEWLFLSDTVETIADEAFYGMEGLKYLVGAGHAEYGRAALRDCKSLSVFSMSEGMENIPETLFYGCTSLEKLYLPEQYTGSSMDAFINLESGQCTVYGLEHQRDFIKKALMNFVDRTEHIHEINTEVILEPTEFLGGAKISYCTECHFVETAEILSATVQQKIEVPAVTPAVVKTPAPFVSETPAPAQTPTAEPIPTAEPAQEATAEPAPTVSPENSPTSVPTETPAPTETPNNTGSPSGGSSGGGTGGSTGGGSTGGGSTGSSGGGGGSFGSGGASAATPSPTPVATQAAGTQEPAVTPLPTQDAASVPDALQSMSPSPTPEAVPQVSPTAVPAVNSGYVKLKAPSVSIKLNQNNFPVLKWKKVGDASGYIIYRSLKKGKSYLRISKLNSTGKNKYVDKKASFGKKYYYRICAYALAGDKEQPGKLSSIRKIKTLPLITPRIKADAGKTADGVRFIQISLKKYSGTNIAIYIMGGDGKYRRLKLTASSIEKYNGKFRLRYNSKKKVCRLKVRTFIRKNKKA